jgi:PAS domain S-box-containing protein
MQDEDKAKEQLITELHTLRQRLVDSQKDKAERKQAEEALFEFENMFKSFAEQALAGIYILQDGVFKYVNARFAQMFGYTVEECLNEMPFQNLVYAEDLATVEEQVRRRVSGEAKSVHYTFRGLRKNGQIFHVEVYGAPSIYKGEPAGAGTILDITERKLMEQEIRQTNAYLENMFENSPDAIAITDNNGRFIRWNKMAEDLYGYTFEEMKGKSGFDLYADKDELEKMLMSLGREGSVKKWEMRMQRKDGSIVPFEISIGLLKDSQNGTIGSVCVARNLSETKETLAALRASNDQLNQEIIERKRSENALHESEERYRQVVQNTNEAIIVAQDGKLKFVNRVASEIFDFPEGELLSRPFVDFIHKDDRSMVMDNHLRRLRGETLPARYPFRLVGKDGGTRWVQIGAAMIEWEGRAATLNLLTDITERKLAEESLRESEELYRTLVNLSPDAISVVDVNGLLTFGSPKALQMFGYSPDDEILGRSILLWIAPEEHEKVSTNIRRLLTEGTPTATEHTLIKKDGTRFIGEINAAVIHSPDGSPMRMIAITRDVTERKRVEEALRESEQRLSQIIDFLPDATFAIDLNGKVIAWNRAIEEMTGVKAEQILGKGDYEYTLPFYGTRRPVLIDLVFTSGEEIKNTYHFVKKEGDVLLAEGDAPVRGEQSRALWGKARPLYDTEENIVGAIEAIRDITERTKHTREIEHLNRLYSVLSRVSQAVVRATSPEEFLAQACRDVVEGGGFLLAWIGQVDLMTNAVVPTAVWGGIGEYVRGITVYADNRPEGRGPTGTCIREGHPSVHNDFLHSPQTLPWRDRAAPFGIASCAAFPIERAGGPWGALSIYSDEIDRFSGEDVKLLEKVASDIEFALDNLDREFQRKRAEEEKEKLETQLFQAQKMESVGRLAGGVAHDFNNMLSVIIGRAEMALEKGVSTDKLQHNLDEILKAGLRSADLTRQLLAFARKQTAIPKIMDLNETISGILKMLRRLIGEDIDLLWAPGLDLWKVKIDPSQVDQILANLAVNARDAISGVGAVTMRTENVVIDDSKRAETPECMPGDYVLLTVSDTGVGMSKEVRENIFEPFFTTKEVGKGTGLGLSTVYGIVKQNDGFIYVASEPGKGTTFKIYLPRFKAATAPAHSGEVAGKRPTGKETILLVEDDEAILDLGKVILENLGYTVLAARTPVDAMNLVEEHPEDIHLLITDVVMPEMHGRELAEKLSAIRPDLKCLYMSGYTADVIAHRGILDEGLNFIQKPFGSDDLAVRVRQVLDHLE